MLTYVDLATARAAKGIRLVTAGGVPSPWSEAAKGLFHLAGVPALVTRSLRDNSHMEWTKHHNVPVVFCDDEPARTVWSQILMLAVRESAPGTLLPVELDRRAAMVGMIHEIAGEQGLGWNARLMMIHASLISDGARGFSLPVATYLAAKYGYSAERVETARAQVIATAAALAGRLGGSPYYGGERPSALDVYSATFLTPLTDITPDVCPQMVEPMRAAFASAKEELARYVPDELFEHRKRMFAHHLPYPIQLTC